VLPQVLSFRYAERHQFALAIFVLKPQRLHLGAGHSLAVLVVDMSGNGGSRNQPKTDVTGPLPGFERENGTAPACSPLSIFLARVAVPSGIQVVSSRFDLFEPEAAAWICGGAFPLIIPFGFSQRYHRFLERISGRSP